VDRAEHLIIIYNFNQKIMENELTVVCFTNINDKDFVGQWDGVPYPIKAGETKQFPKFLAEHLAKHLVDRILIDKNEDYGNEL